MICLISIIDSSNPKIFEQFLKHYSAYGISHFYCCFHSVSAEVNSSLEECLDLFHHYSRGGYILYLGEEFNSIVKHQKCMLLSSMSEADGCKWKATVDCDEFYILHEAAEDFIAKIGPHDALRAIMVDRLAHHGFPPLDMDENLFKQFPLNAFVTNDLLRGAVSKVFFYRNGFNISPGAHSINDGKARYHPEWLSCYHFKWHEGCIERTKKRRDYFRKNNFPWWIESDRFIKNYRNCWDFIADPQVGRISKDCHVAEFDTRTNRTEWIIRNVSLTLEKGYG